MSAAFEAPANFSFFHWENGDTEDRIADQYVLNKGLPKPPDRWVPGPARFAKKGGGGIDLNRAEAIRRTRHNKRRQTNRAFFVDHILPTLRPKLNPRALLELRLEFSARDCSLTDQLLARQLAEEGGWRLWRLGEKSSWVHVDDADKIGQAQKMGAAIDTQ